MKRKGILHIFHHNFILFICDSLMLRFILLLGFMLCAVYAIGIAQDSEYHTVQIIYAGTAQPDTSDNAGIIDIIPCQPENPLEKQEEMMEFIRKQNIRRNNAGQAQPDLSTEFVVQGTTLFNSGFEGRISTINPPDNTMAINSRGEIVTAINSVISIYSVQGTLLYNRSMQQFFASAVNGQIKSRVFCDPRILFDRQEKRFIVMAMTCEGNPATSQIVMAFSKTENPLDGWNIYVAEGNASPPFGRRVWVDFPNMGINNSDLFITVNFFDESRAYYSTGIYQLPKQKCYQGDSLRTQDIRLWINLPEQPYALHPITSINPDSSMYFIYNSFGNESVDSLTIYQITGSGNKATLIVQSVKVRPYQPAGFARQAGSQVLLTNFDQRGSGSFMLNGRIHYVFTKDAENGFAGIQYTVLEKRNNRWNAKIQRTIAASGQDYTYGAIAPVQWDDNSENAILQFTSVSSQEFPGIKALMIDKNGMLSMPVQIRKGDGAVTFQSFDNLSRWADYTALVPDINDKNTVWGFAPYGRSTGVWGNYISRISLDKINSVVAEIPATYSFRENNTMLFMEIECDMPQQLDYIIINLMGSVILKGSYQADAGNHQISISTDLLQSGFYSLCFYNNNQVLLRKNLNIIR
jgi:hypothetical protein